VLLWISAHWRELLAFYLIITLYFAAFLNSVYLKKICRILKNPNNKSDLLANIGGVYLGFLLSIPFWIIVLPIYLLGRFILPWKAFKNDSGSGNV